MVLRLATVRPEVALRLACLMLACLMLACLVLAYLVLARQELRLEALDLLGREPPGQMGILRVPGYFASQPVDSAVRRLACRPVLAPRPVKAAGQWRAVKLER